MKARLTKGEYGYLEYQKKRTALRTLFYFALSLAIYGLGIYSTGSNKNLLTIVAVLGCLPACKSLVNTIIYFRASGCGSQARERLSAFDDRLRVFYDMYFTAYRDNFPISHMTLKGNVLCAYTESAKCDCKAGEKHIEQMLAQGGYKNITIKIFDNLDKYIDRLSQLEELDVAETKNTEDIIQTLYSISL